MILLLLTGGWCGVRFQEGSGLWHRAEVVPDQRKAQHPCQRGGAVLEELQQGRLLHPRSWRGEIIYQKEDMPGRGAAKRHRIICSSKMCQSYALIGYTITSLFSFFTAKCHFYHIVLI